MTNPNHTHIVLVVDESGSMGSIRHDADGSINTFLKDQKKVEGSCTVSLIKFNDSVRLVSDTTLAETSFYGIHPSGMTALNDAIGRAISETGSKLAAMPPPKRPGKVVVVIVTDGQENASKEYTKAQVKEAIAHQESRYGWEFLFLSSDLDADNQAFDYGIRNFTQMAGTGAAYGQTFSVASSLISSYRGAGGQTMGRLPDAVDADGNVTQ